MTSLVDLWMDKGNQPDEEVLQIIQGFRKSGKKCYLASNQEKTRANFISEEMNFINYFDGLFFSCDFEINKPNPLFFEIVSEEIGIRSNRVKSWDDNLSNVIAARNFGWQAELFTGKLLLETE